MLNDHTYNLLLQLTEESKSLKRIKENYLKDHGECPECDVFWSKMEKDKENHINELTELIKKHL